MTSPLTRNSLPLWVLLAAVVVLQGSDGGDSPAAGEKRADGTFHATTAQHEYDAATVSSQSEGERSAAEALHDDSLRAVPPILPLELMDLGRGGVASSDGDSRDGDDGNTAATIIEGDLPAASTKVAAAGGASSSTQERSASTSSAQTTNAAGDAVDVDETPSRSESATDRGESDADESDNDQWNDPYDAISPVASAGATSESSTPPVASRDNDAANTASSLHTATETKSDKEEGTISVSNGEGALGNAIQEESTSTKEPQGKSESRGIDAAEDGDSAPTNEIDNIIVEDATGADDNMDQAGAEEDDDDGDNADVPLQTRKPLLVDYANKNSGGIVLESSSATKGASNLLVSDNDRYAITPCDEAKKYVVISLSEDIHVKEVRLSNYERYSSHVKDFQILGSQTMGDWVDLGVYTAGPANGEQSFDLKEPSWARYLMFRFVSHYGEEHYCTVSQIKVHGSTMTQGFHEQWQDISSSGDEDDKDEKGEVLEHVGDEDVAVESEMSSMDSSSHPTTATTVKEEETVDDSTDLSTSTSLPVGTETISDGGLGPLGATEQATGGGEGPVSTTAIDMNSEVSEDGVRNGSTALLEEKPTENTAGDQTGQSPPSSSTRIEVDTTTEEKGDGDEDDAATNQGGVSAIPFDEPSSSRYNNVDDEPAKSTTKDAIVGDRPTGDSDDDSLQVPADDAQEPSEEGDSGLSLTSASTEEDSHIANDVVGGSRTVLSSADTFKDAKIDGEDTGSLLTDLDGTNLGGDGASRDGAATVQGLGSDSDSDVTHSDDISSKEVQVASQELSDPAIGDISSDLAGSVENGCHPDPPATVDVGAREENEGGVAQNQLDERLMQGAMPDHSKTNALSCASIKTSSSSRSTSRDGEDGSQQLHLDGRAPPSGSLTSTDTATIKVSSMTDAVKAVVAEATTAIKSVKEASTVSDAVREIQRVIWTKMTTGPEESGGEEGRGAQESPSEKVELSSHVVSRSSESTQDHVLEDSLPDGKTTRNASADVIPERITTLLAATLYGDEAIEGDDESKEGRSGELHSDVLSLTADKNDSSTAGVNQSGPAAHSIDRSHEDMDPGRDTTISKSEESSQTKTSPSVHQDDKSAEPSSIPEDDNLSAGRVTVLGTDIASVAAELARRFPNTACLGELDLKEFKANASKGRSGTKQATGSGNAPHSIGGGVASGPGKMEPIFKTLSDEIKSLQMSQSVHDLYLKAVVACYQQVILDVVTELDVVRNDQNQQIRALEDAVQDLQSKTKSTPWYEWLVFLLVFVFAVGVTLYEGAKMAVNNKNTQSMLENVAGFVEQRRVAIGGLVMLFLCWRFLHRRRSRRRQQCCNKKVQSKTSIIYKENCSKSEPAANPRDRTPPGTPELIG